MAAVFETMEEHLQPKCTTNPENKFQVIFVNVKYNRMD